MSKASLTFQELIELINSSVESGKVKDDYSDFLKSCKELGISSYVLNTLIQKAREAKKTNHQTQTDSTFFIPKKDIQDTREEEDLRTETVTITKTSKTAWVIVIVLLLCCVIETFLFINERNSKDYLRYRLEETDRQKMGIEQKLSLISSMTSQIQVDTRYRNWSSTNHGHHTISETSYYISAKSGDELSFNYTVSSEYNYDFLTITLKGGSGNTTFSRKELIKVSGESNKSYSYKFYNSGNYILDIKYSKDYSINKFNDNASISNIILRRNYKNILDSIHTIIYN